MEQLIPQPTVRPEGIGTRAARPELLAPAGDWECAKAAVENGADAIYFGLDRFNARMRAHNFTEADLPGLMEFLHRRGVKGYVTFNTLVFADELAGAEQYLRTMIAAGVDAAIVQDVGVARLIRQISRDFPIHASTQMTITSAAGVAFAKELGCNLVVLARECSIADIEKIRAGISERSHQLSAASNQEAEARASQSSGSLRTASSITDYSLPLEVFVHGALCVAYSGQCLTSESLGGRSANRGECAQACRMPYDLISDGQEISLGQRKYLLSPQDLAGLEVVPDLVRAGVASFKIEGRLKAPEYVANITRIYRRAIDAAFSSAPADTNDEQARYEMEMAFSRGLYTGWLGGINNQELVHANFGKKRGVYLGKVTRVGRETVTITLEGPLKPGDGVVFDAGKPEEQEQGGRVYEVRNRGRQSAPLRGSAPTDLGGYEAELGFGRGAMDFTRVHVGDKVWKTSDPELERRLRQTFAGDKAQFQRPIGLEIHGHAGIPLTVIARDEGGHIAQGSSAVPLESARTQPLTTDRLREQLGRLGGTPFRLQELTSHLEGEVMLPVSELNRIRREVVAELERQRAQPLRWTVNERPTAVRRRQIALAPTSGDGLQAEMIVLVRSLAQLEVALRCGVQTIYCELEDPKKYREAVTTVRCAAGCHTAGPAIWVAPPRITKPGEEWVLKQVRSCDADGYLIRNYDHLQFFADCRRRGDFSLNVANGLTAEYFVERYGLERVTASYDLNQEQLVSLLRSAPPEWFEITLHQHMPMFHMEHCVFCAFLSNGTDYRNCGRPCDTREVKLRDRVGMEHPLKADAGCRNTLFNALAQTGAEYASRFMELGARSFRIEFLNETPDQVARTISMYRRLLRGEVTGYELWRELKVLNQLGVTRGQMEKR